MLIEAAVYEVFDLEFAHAHPLEYEDFSQDGRLDQYQVDAPSRPMTVGSTYWARC